MFAIARLGWIRQQQQTLRAQERETPREYLDRESHYVWGRRYLLEVVEQDAASRVLLTHGRLRLVVRPGADVHTREATVAAWYRQILRAAAAPLIEAWQPRLGVAVRGLSIQRMKTKWGSCNPTAGTIRLNTELAKKPRECLEYLVVHEMAHLLEPTHGQRFVAVMDHSLPTWRDTRNLMNSLPARHEEWVY